MATEREGGRPGSAAAKPLVDDKYRKIADLEAALAATQTELKETQERFDIEMHACGLNHKNVITDFSDFVEKAVANASYASSPATS